MLGAYYPGQSYLGQGPQDVSVVIVREQVLLYAIASYAPQAAVRASYVPQVSARGAYSPAVGDVENYFLSTWLQELLAQRGWTE
jgi:hypothetical protein